MTICYCLRRLENMNPETGLAATSLPGGDAADPCIWHRIVHPHTEGFLGYFIIDFDRSLLLIHYPFPFLTFYYVQLKTTNTYIDLSFHLSMCLEIHWSSA